MSVTTALPPMRRYVAAPSRAEDSECTWRTLFHLNTTYCHKQREIIKKKHENVLNNRQLLRTTINAMAEQNIANI